MKTANLLTIFVFVIAIGTAIASERSTTTQVWTSKQHVNLQTEDCVLRDGNCPGGSVDCSVTFSIGVVTFSNIPAYDGGEPIDSMCGTRLKRN